MYTIKNEVLNSASATIRRRRILASGIGATSSLFFNKKASALGQCNWVGPGLKACTVGISSSLIGKVAERQQMNEWCWVASMSMIFAYYGHSVSQERIVQEAFGSIQNVPGTPPEILAGLNRVWLDDDHHEFEVHGDESSANVVTAAQDLNQDHPLLIGFLGHCTVLTALTYLLNMAGQFQIRAATIRDPSPFSPGERYLTPIEWDSAYFLARVRVN